MNGSKYVTRIGPGRRKPRGEGPRIGRLDIELTERCNNDCIHCCINLPATDSIARAKEMRKDRVKGILRQAAHLGCLEVRFTGGEPLLRPDFDELYLYARRLGMRVLLFTNARLISRELADLFAKIPPLAPVEITVYGMTRTAYESVSRVGGSYEQFRRGVNLLLDRKVPLIVKSVVLPQNRDEMQEFDAWARTIPSMSEPPAYTVLLDLRHRRDNRDKNETIVSLRLSPGNALTVFTRDAQRFRRETAEFASKYIGPPGDRLFACGAGRNICIDAYGRAQPCMGVRTPDLAIEIAADASPAQVDDPTWVGENGSFSLADALDRFSSLSDLRARNPEYLGSCAKCFIKGLCEQCPGKSWIENGTLDTPVSYSCDVAHEQAYFMGWLAREEKAWEVVDWRSRLNVPAG